eukprot:Gregarina_sp_Pseudo_9__2034@NODE_240_length_3462_cov_14_410459_g224_i0_p3_GENE_NODE_240_length_3462_cov_14_410459_g224_i0NODE_240_length_3462_cov_14_410459_g224_i0_p3_ORF_typecomplete_len304_score51_46Ebola_NP/PF05505_12/0_00015Ebola_NP/PF05505_12/4_3e02DUF3656/PF12392_8/1_4DUF3656/PF12392_8/1_2_NODE_240_length_3462_cov_14_410459_g224_i05711482
MAASNTNLTIILTALVCAAIAAILIFQFQDFVSTHRHWQGVKVKTNADVSAAAKKRRKRVKKPKSEEEPKLANPIVLLDEKDDSKVEDSEAAMSRKKELDESLTKTQLSKLKDTRAKLLLAYQQQRKTLSNLKAEQRKRMFAGNSFATRLDIMDDSDDESELDVSEVPLLEVAEFITEEIDRVKADITEIKKALSPPPSSRQTKHVQKPLPKKKQLDDEGWQTIGTLPPRPPAKAQKAPVHVSFESNEPVVSIGSDDDNEGEWQEAGAVSEANKSKAAKKRAAKKKSKKVSQHPPIPGLVYVK